MIIRKETNGNHVTLAFSGKLNSDTYGSLNDAVLALDYTELDLTLDFSEVEYITSAALRVLLMVMKRLPEDRFRIVNVSETVKEVFDTTGLSKLAEISLASNRKEPHIEVASIKKLLAQNVLKTGDKKIYWFGDMPYTWSDVDRASQIIANDLSALGVGKGSHVGILSANSINWIFTFYAVQKLGGILILLNSSLKPGEVITYSQIGDITYLCLGDYSSPLERAEYIQAVCSPESRVQSVYDISSSRDFSARFEEYPALAGKFTEDYDADDPSLMIFTSGSTGKPKGVLSSTRDRLINQAFFSDKICISSEDRICQYLPLFHIFGYGSGLITSLAYNIPVFFTLNTASETLLHTMEKYQCTLFHTVPTKILSLADNAGFSPERVASIRCSTIGGAAISSSQLENLCKKFPATHFICIYGMSEISPISIMEYEDTPEHITKTVGKPVSNISLQIRDHATGEECPAGTQGEIVVKSDTSMICYYKLDLEHQAIDENGWIPTGDLGVIHEDGYLSITGRAKELIIRGGENISPNEVAAAICEMDEVEDCKVVGIPDDLLGETVAAAIIMKEGQNFDREKINAYALSKLAKFKVPVFYAEYRSFPLLPSGKADMLTLKKELIAMAK